MNLIYVAGTFDIVFSPEFENATANIFAFGVPIFVVNLTSNMIQPFAAAQDFTNGGDGGWINSIAVDSSTGFLYMIGGWNSVNTTESEYLSVFGFNGSVVFDIRGAQDYVSGTEGPTSEWLYNIDFPTDIAVDPNTHYVYAIVTSQYTPPPSSYDYLTDGFGNPLSGLVYFDGNSWFTLVVGDILESENEDGLPNSIYFSTGPDYNNSLIILGIFDNLATTNPALNTLSPHTGGIICKLCVRGLLLNCFHLHKRYRRISTGLQPESKLLRVGSSPRTLLARLTSWHRIYGTSRPRECNGIRCASYAQPVCRHLRPCAGGRG